VSFNRDIVNSRGGSSNPLRVLADFASTLKHDDDQKESVHKCLEHLLNAEPDPTADFFTALQSLPDWLSEQAVVMDVVQVLLNEKISQRFPSFILLVDFYVLVMVIGFYSYNVIESIDKRHSHDETGIPETPDIDKIWLIPLYVGGGYFLLREVIQLISLLSLKAFNVWVYDPSNWLNIIFVFFVLYWTVRMDTGTGETGGFRIGAALSVTMLWFKMLVYLKNIYIDFAVFVGGVIYVVNRLAAFLVSLGIILVAFSQIFYTLYLQTDYCLQQPLQYYTQEMKWDDLKCEELELRPFCNHWDSFLRVYTMLLGEVDEDDFKDSGVATAMFVFFMLLVVILLANVLIAIVTDSYKVIQDQRAAIVFWTNRLDFVAEMDAIANGPWKAKLKKALGWDDDGDAGMNSTEPRKKKVFGYESWKRMMDLFEDEIDDSVVSLEYFLYTLLRFCVALIVIPVWICLGIFTAGWLWPPQIREAVFTSSVFKHSSDTEKEDELRKTQVKKLEQEVKELKDELVQELAMDRTQVVQMKSAVAERKVEIANEMKHVKRIVTMLFEQQAGFG
jgi:ribosomal protein L29